MSQLLPNATSVADICKAALLESGAIGVGQTPLAEDINDAWTRLQWMLQEWNRKRWLVFHLETMTTVSTGATSYSIGPGGDFDTGTLPRPDRLEDGNFLRQLTQSQPNQIDYPLILLQSMEDYNKIALKQLVSFPYYIYYDPGYPLGTVYAWPVPQASIYSLGILFKSQLPVSFSSASDEFVIPLEYLDAMVLNLAVRLRPKYGIRALPGDQLIGLAKDALNVLRGSNAQIARLHMPEDLARPGIYNIFSDQFY